MPEAVILMQKLYIKNPRVLARIPLSKSLFAAVADDVMNEPPMHGGDTHWPFVIWHLEWRKSN